MHDRMTQLSFWSRFRSKKKYTTRPLLDSIPTRKIDSISRSFRSAHWYFPIQDTFPTTYFSLRLTLISWTRSLARKAGVPLSGQRYFSRKKRKKINAKRKRGNKRRGRGKTGENRDGGAYARSKSKGKTELRHARHPNVTRYIRNERENEYECWDH